MIEKPIARALFVCEKTIVEEGTHNFTIVNAFNLRRVESLPQEVPFTIAAMLANGFGSIPLVLSIIRLKDNERIYRRTFVVRFPNPLTVAQFALNLRHTFGNPGGYEVELAVDEEVLAVTRFELKLYGD